MSRNNLILVVHFAGRHYVIRDINADTQWNSTYAAEYIAQSSARWSKSRADALVLAHNMDNSINTEYGVREMFLGDNRRKRTRDEEDVTTE